MIEFLTNNSKSRSMIISSDRFANFNKARGIPELELTDAIDLQAWRRDAAIGATLTYHSGMLCADRLRSAEVDAVGNDAWNLYMKGSALLTQRKIAFGKYEYIITACDAKPVVEKI